MIKKGSIKLIYKGCPNRQELYNCPASRQTIIDKWSKLIGKRFDQCYIQIYPIPDEEGMNKIVLPEENKFLIARETLLT